MVPWWTLLTLTADGIWAQKTRMDELQSSIDHVSQGNLINETNICTQKKISTNFKRKHFGFGTP